MTKRHFSTKNTTSTGVFEDAQPIEFTIDKDTYTAYPPKAAQFAYFIATQAKNRDTSDNMAGVIDFFDGLFEEADRERLRSRMLDRNDPMEFSLIEDLVDMLMEEWMERPTSAASESSASPRTTATNSTAKRRSRASTS
jgi:hypothetical protein